MRILSFVFVLLLAITLNSCSDDPASSEGGHEITLLSIDRDSVYWEEAVVITVQGEPADSFTVFMQSLQAEVDSVWHSGPSYSHIRFRVPINASSGPIRLYANATLGKGEVMLTVLQRSINDFFSDVYTFSPESGATGDTIVIVGQDLPERRRDIEVTIGSMTVPIERWDASQIVIPVTEDLQSGLVRVRLFDRVVTLNQFTKLKLQTDFAQVVRHFEIHIGGLKGESRRLDKTSGNETVSELLQLLDLYFTVAPIEATVQSDSLLFIGEETIEMVTKRIELRLKPQSNNSVSGILRATYFRASDGWFDTVDVEIANMKWTKDENYYTISARKEDVTSQLKRFYFKEDNPTTRDIRVYEETTQGGFIEIKLVQ